MWPERPRRYALGISTPKRLKFAAGNTNKRVCTTFDNNPDNRSDYEQGTSQEPSSVDIGVEKANSHNETDRLDASFVSAKAALEDDLRCVDWASPIPVEKHCTINKISQADKPKCKLNIRPNQENSVILNEIKDLSDDMFKSRLEINCTNNHDSSLFCKTTQYRREVESVFNKLELSLCGGGSLSEHTSMKTNKVDLNENSFSQKLRDQENSDIFDLKDSFLLDVKENDPITEIAPVPKTQENRISDFYGLPFIAKSLFNTFKNVDKLYDWQDECLNLAAIKERKNLIYALPTSGGKTLVAEILMLKEIVCRKKNVLFILPFVALVQEKVWGLSPFAVQMNFLIEEYAAGKGNFPPKKRRTKNTIYMATLEKGLGLVRSLIELKRLNEIGLVVVDELHLVGEPSRGSTLEMLLASVIYTTNAIQIIGMSATIGNIDELAKFLKAEVYSNQFRPVELKEYVKVGQLIHSITWTNGQMDINTDRHINFGYSPQVEKLDPDHLGGLVMEVIPNGSVLIFCPTKKNCENVAVLLCKVIFRKLLEHKEAEKRQLLKSLKSETGQLCSVLAGAVPWGVAYHHSGLTAEERKLLEDGFRSGVISVLCCTSTLAAGVNLPATRVILRSPYVGRDFISLSTYKQMAGRAGRAGYGSFGESIVVCPADRFRQLCDLLNQPMDKATSTLHCHGGAPLRGFVLSAIGLGMATNRERVSSLLKTSLMGVQAERLSLDLKQLANDTLKDLITSGAVEVVQPIVKASNSSDADDSGGSKKLVVYSDSTFRVSKLGKAAIKGCMDLQTAHQLYSDMETAQKNLVVMGVLHLLYLVTPYEYTGIQPNMAAYYTIYSSLDSEGVQTAKVLGITESNAVRMVTGKAITNVPDAVLSRFYVTLMLHDLWGQTPVADVAEKYHVNRGTVQTMMVSTASFASNVLRFCEELEQFWAFRDLLLNFTKRVAHCCAPELLPLMELPNVKKARAMQLYKSGYRRLEDIARASAADLVESIDRLSRKVAAQLISSAKMLLIEKVENLREEAEDVMEGLGVLSLE